MRLYAWLLAAAALLGLNPADAAPPVRCSPGYQDSSCAHVLLNPPQTPPTCPNGAGWRTVSPAVWLGSKYSTPNCSFTAAPSCPGGYSEAVAPTWDGTAWVGQQCVLIPPPPPTCPAGQTQTVPPTWNGSAWVGMQCVAPQVPQPPAPTCPAGDTQTAAPTWDGSAWVGLACQPPPPSCPSGQVQDVAPTWDGSAWVGQLCSTPSTPPPPAPTCPSGQTQVVSPSWNGSAWVGLQCVTPPPPAPTCPSGQTQIATPTWNGSSWVGLQCQPPAPTCPSGQTQTTAPVWNGSAWVGLQCVVVPPPPPTCPSGQTQTVAPTWNGSAWVGLQCVPTQTPTPPEVPATIDYVLSSTSAWQWYYWNGTFSSGSSSSWGPLSVTPSGSSDCTWIDAAGYPVFMRCSPLSGSMDAEASSAYSSAANACDADSISPPAYVDQCVPYAGTGMYPDSQKCSFKSRSGKVGKTSWSCTRWWVYVADESGNPANISKTIAVRLQR